MTATETPPTPETTRRRCPRCGSDLTPDQEWCLNCGADVGSTFAPPPSWRGPVALVAGLLAIAVLLRYLRSHGLGIFVVYRLALAALVVVAWLGLWDR